MLRFWTLTDLCSPTFQYPPIPVFSRTILAPKGLLNNSLSLHMASGLKDQHMEKIVKQCLKPLKVSTHFPAYKYSCI